MKLEDILKALGADSTILKGVLEYVLKTPDGAEALTNYSKPLIDKAIGEKTSEIYNAIDNDLFEALGARKKGDQKTFEFIKEIATAYKTLKDKPETDKELTDKIAELTTKLQQAEEKSKGSEDWHNKYLSALNDWEKKSEEFTKQIADLNIKGLESLVAADLAQGLAGLRFNPAIPKTLIDVTLEKIKQDVLKTAKVVDGKVVYYNEDGTEKRNGLYKPISAKEIYETELKDVILTTTVGGGAAPKTETQGITTIGEGDSAKKRIDLDPTKFSTKLDFAKHIEEKLLESGIERNSKDWVDLTQTAREEYGVDKMERV